MAIAILGSHPLDEELDLYLLEQLSQVDVNRVEEHYIVCPDCLERLESASLLLETAGVLRRACPVLVPMPTVARVRRIPIPGLKRSANYHMALAAAASIIVALGVSIALDVSILSKSPLPEESSSPPLSAYLAEVGPTAPAFHTEVGPTPPLSTIITKSARRSVQARRPRHPGRHRYIPVGPRRYYAPELQSQQPEEVASADLQIPTLDVEQSSGEIELEVPQLEAPHFRRRHWFVRAVLVLAAPFKHEAWQNDGSD